MGKETKIGLAVIGVLLAIFAALLFRHLGAGRSLLPIEHDDVAAGELSAEGMNSPNVVVAAGDDGAGRVKQSLWDTPAEPVATTVEPEPEPASYAAAEAEPAEIVQDPYAEPVETASTTDDLAPVGTSPFQRGGAVNASGPEAMTSKRRGNPLRQMSAELPLEVPDQADAGDVPADAGYETETPDWSQDLADRYERQEAAEVADPFADMQPARQPQGATIEAAAAPQPSGQPDFAGATQPVDEPYQDDILRQPLDALPAQQPQHDPFGDNARTNQHTGQASPATATNDWQSDFGSQGTTAAAASAEPAPPVIENGMYTVQPGDTLWSISEKVYGTGGYFKALAAHNRANLPRSDRLTVGNQIAVPSTDELEQVYPSLCPRERHSALVQPQVSPQAAQRRRSADVYVVIEGDTLFDIARYELGKASRWAEIYELNRDILGEDFDYLRPGTELVMPPRSTPAAEVSRASGSRYQ